MKECELCGERGSDLTPQGDEEYLCPECTRTEEAPEETNPWMEAWNGND